MTDLLKKKRGDLKGGERKAGLPLFFSPPCMAKRGGGKDGGRKRKGKSRSPTDSLFSLILREKRKRGGRGEREKREAAEPSFFLPVREEKKGG